MCMWLGETRRATQDVDALRALHGVAERMRDAGESQPEVERAFEAVLGEITSSGEAKPGDAVEDILDRIVGWCPFDERIFG